MPRWVPHPTVGFHKFMFYIFFQTVGLEILACTHFLRQTMKLLWFNTWIYIFGYGMRDPRWFSFCDLTLWELSVPHPVSVYHGPLPSRQGERVLARGRLCHLPGPDLGTRQGTPIPTANTSRIFTWIYIIQGTTIPTSSTSIFKLIDTSPEIAMTCYAILDSSTVDSLTL